MEDDDKQAIYIYIYMDAYMITAGIYHAPIEIYVVSGGSVPYLNKHKVYMLFCVES